MTLVSDAPHLQCAAVNKMCSRISSDTGRVSVRKHFHFIAQYFTQHYVATFYFTVIHIVFWGIAARFAPAAWMPESDGARIWAFKQEQDKRSFNLCTAVRELRATACCGAAHMKVPSVLLTISVYLTYSRSKYCLAGNVFAAVSPLPHLVIVSQNHSIMQKATTIC